MIWSWPQWVGLVTQWYPLNGCDMAPVELRLGWNMSWGIQSPGSAPRSKQVTLLSQSQDNTLVIKNKGGTRKPKTLLKYHKISFPNFFILYRKPYGIWNFEPKSYTNPLWKNSIWPPYKSIQKETNTKTFRMMLLESNRERMIPFKKAWLPPLMLSLWVTGFKKQTNHGEAIVKD